MQIENGNVRMLVHCIVYKAVNDLQVDYSKFLLKVTVNLLFIPHFRSNKARVGGGGGYLGKFKLGMCHWPLRAPTPLQSILIDPILVTFGQICNVCHPNLVTFYFYELTHFLNLVKNTQLFTYTTKYSGTFANHKYEKLSYLKESENV